MAILKKFLASATTTFNNNSRKKKTRKSVSFVDETPIRISSNGSMDRSGRSSIIVEVEKFINGDEIWFSKNEERSFKERDQKLVLSLKTLTPQALEQQTGDCPRGLEHGICYETLNGINNRRQRSLNCVFASQSLFKKQGRDGSESIAKSYSMVCDEALKTAIQLAKQDEDYVDSNIHKLGSSRSLLSSSTLSSSSYSDASSSETSSPIKSSNNKKCNPIKKMFNGGKKCPSAGK